MLLQRWTTRRLPRGGAAAARAVLRRRSAGSTGLGRRARRACWAGPVVHAATCRTAGHRGGGPALLRRMQTGCPMSAAVVCCAAARGCALLTGQTQAAPRCGQREEAAAECVVPATVPPVGRAGATKRRPSVCQELRHSVALLRGLGAGSRLGLVAVRGEPARGQQVAAGQLLVYPAARRCRRVRWSPSWHPASPLRPAAGRRRGDVHVAPAGGGQRASCRQQQ